MPESKPRTWWQIDQAAKETDDVDQLRSLVTEATGLLQEAENELAHIESRRDATEKSGARARAAILKTAEQRARIQSRVIAQLEKLLPKAQKQASAGKPALLRMILRATK